MGKQTYIPRLADAKLGEYLGTFGAVVVEGPKWCGKTTTSAQQAASELRIADPTGDYQNRRLATLDPAEALKGERPRLLDEWQEVPSLWDVVRFECDMSMGEPGQFILTGSATPKEDGKPAHSGAGRMGRMRMGTLTLQELGVSTGQNGLQSLLDGMEPSGAGRMSVKDIADAVCKGGWPAAARMDVAQAQLIAGSYIDAVVDEDMRAATGTRHDPAKVRRLIVSLARNESTLASLRTLALDADAGRGTGPSDDTVSSYLMALERMFFVDDIPAWNPALRSPVRIRAASKRHLADPSLAASAMGATPQALLGELKTLGCLYESLALHDILAYARMLGYSVWHYRDDSGLEVDCIVQKPSGEWGAIEIKLGSDQVEKGAQSVSRLDRKMRERGERSAALKAVIVGVGGVAQRLSDGVYVVPIDTLGV